MSDRAFCGLPLAYSSPEQESGATLAAPDPVVEKARRILRTNAYTRDILDANKGKDLLNPGSRIYRNRVVVDDGDDGMTVTFSQDGRPHDSPSISFIVRFGTDQSLSRIDVQILPGGME